MAEIQFKFTRHILHMPDETRQERLKLVHTGRKEKKSIFAQHIEERLISNELELEAVDRKDWKSLIALSTIRFGKD